MGDAWTERHRLPENGFMACRYQAKGERAAGSVIDDEVIRQEGIPGHDQGLIRAGLVVWKDDLELNVPVAAAVEPAVEGVGNLIPAVDHPIVDAAMFDAKESVVPEAREDIEAC